MGKKKGAVFVQIEFADGYRNVAKMVLDAILRLDPNLRHKESERTETQAYNKFKIRII